jgi:Flp pilus assembly pilin Flp
MASLFAKCRAVRSFPDRGATSIEYGIMAMTIALVILGAVSLVGTNLASVITDAAGMF